MSCSTILGSWVLIFIGFAVYEEWGLLVSAIPFGLAALLRGDRERELITILAENRKVQMLVLFYYMGLIIPAFFFTHIFYEMNAIYFVVLLSFPLFVSTHTSDMFCCFNKRQR